MYNCVVTRSHKTVSDSRHECTHNHIQTVSIDTNNNMHCVCMLHTHASRIDNGHIDLPEMLSWIQYTTVGSNTVLPWSSCLHFENDSVICRII